MTKLFATAESIAVDKLLDFQKPVQKKVVENPGRLASMPKELSEEDLVSERTTIEVCASSGKTYTYSSNWTDDVKQQLVEYASICGCQSYGVDPEVKEIPTASIKKEASVSSPIIKEAVNTLDIGDVFGIDVKGDTSHLAKTKWEQITAESKILTPDVTTHRSGSILPIGGGETYEKSPTLRVKPGQNSVTSPDAIGELLRGKGEDIGTSIKRQNAEKEAIRIAEAKKADEKLSEKMAKDKDYGAYGNRRVHMTESMVAQPGVRDGKIMAGAFQKSVEEMPEKTSGEKLRDQAEQRKSGIQRQTSEKTNFKVEGSAKLTLSDVFTQPEKWLPKQKS